MYSDVNFKSKKALKEAVAAGRRIGVYQPNDMFGRTEAVREQSKHEDVKVSVEGPHYPEAHRWYATVTVRDGVITKVS